MTRIELTCGGDGGRQHEQPVYNAVHLFVQQKHTLIFRLLPGRLGSPQESGNPAVDDLRERVAELAGINLTDFLEEGKGAGGGQAQGGKGKTKVSYELLITTLRQALFPGLGVLHATCGRQTVSSVRLRELGEVLTKWRQKLCDST